MYLARVRVRVRVKVRIRVGVAAAHRCLWLGVAVPLAPVSCGALEGGEDVAEVRQLVQLSDVVPRGLRDPVGARVGRLPGLGSGLGLGLGLGLELGLGLGLGLASLCASPAGSCRKPANPKPNPKPSPEPNPLPCTCWLLSKTRPPLRKKSYSARFIFLAPCRILLQI